MKIIIVASSWIFLEVKWGYACKAVAQCWLRKTLNIKLRNDAMLNLMYLFTLEGFLVRFSAYFDVNFNIIMQTFRINACYSDISLIWSQTRVSKINTVKISILTLTQLFSWIYKTNNTQGIFKSRRTQNSFSLRLCKDVACSVT